MGKIGRYLGLAIVAAMGLYSVYQLNTVGDVIGDMNRDMKQKKAEYKAKAAENESSDEYEVSQPSPSLDPSDAFDHSIEDSKSEDEE